MKKNRVAIILVILLGSISFWLVVNKKSSTIKQELKDFAVDDTVSITKIHLKDKANKEVLLEKMPDGRWKLNNTYMARNDAVKSLLQTMRQIRVRNPVGKRAQDEVVKQLATGCTQVKIYSDDKLIKVYYVGSETQDMEGTYMLLEDPETGEKSSIPFVMYIPGFNGYVSGRYFCNSEEWRDRTIFHCPFNDVKSIEVNYAEHKDSSFSIHVLGENQFEVKNAAGNKIENLDTGKLKLYIGFYFDVQYEGMEKMDAHKKDSLIGLGWVHSIKVTSVDGKSTTLKTYHKPAAGGLLDDNGKPMKWDGDRMYAVMNDNDKEMLLVQYFVFGRLFMPANYFAKKPEKKGPLVGKPIK